MRVVQIARDLRAGEFLEQLRVGPLYAAFTQQHFRLGPASPQAFQQKEGVGKLLAHAGDDVLPDRHRHLVAGVAAKTVHPAPAPGQEGLGELVPKLAVLGIELDQVLPRDAPRPRTHEVTVRAAQKPLRMLLVQGGTPGGVIDHQVEKQPRAV